VTLAETEFVLEYGGPAVDDGTMPIRDLAPSLIALAELFTGASRLINPEADPVSLNIKATGDGSFLVHLFLEAQPGGPWDQFVDSFSSDATDALTNLWTLVVGGATLTVSGLLGFLKYLKNRRIKRAEPGSEAGTIKLTLEDDTTIELPGQVLTLYESIEIRRKAEQVVAPLKRDGIDYVAFREDREREPEVVVRKDDLPAYEAEPGQDVVLLDEVQRKVLTILSVVFVEGNKWRFSEGESSFSAAIEDEAFLGLVRDHVETFGADDMLRCRVRVVQVRRDGKLHTDYTIVEVIEHIPATRGESLFDDDAAAS